MTTDPRDIAPICESIQAPVIAERGPAPLQARGGRARLLKTESGRTVTHGEVMGALLARAEIEVAVVDGKRPEWIACADCKVPVKVQKIGVIPIGCARCTGRECSACGKKRYGKGHPAMCKRCSVESGASKEATHKANAARTPEARQESARKGWSSRTPEQRAEQLRKLTTKTHEQRSDAAHRWMSSRDPQHRSDAARKANESRTPEMRSELARKAVSARTPEQRRDVSLKAAATIRARKAAEATKP